MCLHAKAMASAMLRLRSTVTEVSKVVMDLEKTEQVQCHAMGIKHCQRMETEA